MFPINRWWACLGALILAGLFCNGMLAQMTTGSISGVVMDASEAVIPNTEVSLLSERTGETRKAVSTASGDFPFAAISPEPTPRSVREVLRNPMVGSFLPPASDWFWAT